MLKKNCVVCGKEIHDGKGFCGDFCSESCFTKDFWNKALDNEAIVINGECYHLGDENDTSYFRGYGGHKFVIEMNDGRRIITTNLWNQGTIPEKFFKGNNARFVNE